MAKRLNKAAQAARDAMIQRHVDEAVRPWKATVEQDDVLIKTLQHGYSKSLNGLKQELLDCQRSRNAIILAFTLAAALIATAVTYAVMADNRPVSIHVTPPINTPIVAYTPNGWHQAYVDVSGNIRSMENGQRIKNATSWMKP
jgi:predicted DNA-binding protein (UPF0278 family)